MWSEACFEEVWLGLVSRVRRAFRDLRERGFRTRGGQEWHFATNEIDAPNLAECDNFSALSLCANVNLMQAHG